MDWNKVSTVRCLFCEATVTAIPDQMKQGKRRPYFRGKWLPREAEGWPGFRWGVNGLTGDEKKEQLFFLCPDHQTDKHWERAFNFAQKVINGEVKGVDFSDTPCSG